MRSQLIMALATASVLAAVAAPAAVAASPGFVDIVLDSNFATGVETFTATGAFCASGTAQSSDLRVVGG
ncbi:MAG TPA: hypothetical protein VGK16_09495 [Candidatus Limnocylindrales bacterium]|jgi:hypothetical protein